MVKKVLMKIKYPELGICGLSCRLCPHYHMDTESRCLRCKSQGRMVVGCPFITCAMKKKGIEFCWDCGESRTCEKRNNHREAGKKFDSFKCYQRLEDDIAFIQKNGVAEFEKLQKIREQLLRKILQKFNEGRSKSYYCIAATVLEIEEVKKASLEAERKSSGLDIKDKSRLLHSMFDDIAVQRKVCLKLRKGK